jgi:hypothetical protein
LAEADARVFSAGKRNSFKERTLMVNLHVLLKRLIAANIFLMLAAAFFYFLFFDSLPVELQNYNNRLAEDERENLIVTFVGLPLFFLYVLSLIFLWKLKRFGRTLFTGVWVASLIAGAGMMPAADPTLTELCCGISTLINGLMFGLIYYSDLRFHFEKEAPAEI